MEIPQQPQPSPLRIRSDPRGPRGTIAGATPRTWTDRRRPLRLTDLHAPLGVFRLGAYVRYAIVQVVADGFTVSDACRLTLEDLRTARLSPSTWSALATILRRRPERLRLLTILGERRPMTAELRAELPRIRASRAAARRVGWWRASPAAVATFAGLLAAETARPDHLRPDRHLP